jgi:P-type conjugative transfer protein TrbJ
MRKRILAMFIAGMSSVISPAWAGSIAGTGGSTEVTQILNNTELAAQTAQQIKQTAAQLDMVKTQLQQALTDPNTPFGETMQALTQLNQLYNTSQSIGYSMASVQSQFNNLYSGYGQGGNMLQKITAWGNQTRSSAQGVLSSAGWTMDQVKSEGSLIDSLRARSQSAAGQMQATQAGNAIAIQMTQQLQELRQLQASQAQMMASSVAQQNQKQGDDDANARALIPNTTMDFK